MEFIMDNQPWFLILACLGLLALIGYIADKRKTAAKNLEEEAEAEEVATENEEPAEEVGEIEMEDVAEPEAVNDDLPMEEMEGEEPIILEIVEESPAIEDVIPPIEPEVDMQPVESENVVEEASPDVDVAAKPAPSLSDDDFGIDEIPTLRTAQNKEPDKGVGFWEIK